VTGGCGFLGSAISRALAERGIEVVALDLRRPASDAARVPGVQMVEGDVRDRNPVSRSVAGCDWVFHTAALVGFWRRQNERQWEVNVEGTRTVMQACLEQGVRRIVHTSSVNALGYPRDPGVPADESTPFNWSRFDIGYMNSKHASEQLVLEMAARDHLPAVVVNPGTIFGRGVGAEMGTHMYLLGVARGQIRAFLPGGTNCVGLDDVVRGQILAAEKGRVGERYILGGENLHYGQMFGLIAAEVGARPPRWQVPFRLALGAARALEALAFLTGRPPLLSPEMVKAGRICNFYSSAKAERELGYTHRPFPAVLKETADFLRETGRL
jgi:dihydroflavonol-4-reductase